MSATDRELADILEVGEFFVSQVPGHSIVDVRENVLAYLQDKAGWHKTKSPAFNPQRTRLIIEDKLYLALKFRYNCL